MSAQFMAEAIKLARSLGELAADAKAREATAEHAAHKQLAAHDAQTCENAAAMLQKLSTEVSRLREGIGCFYYGRLDRRELWRMSQNWNGSAAGQRGGGA